MEKPADNRAVIKTLAALGVVFGDIGTSPLYAFATALSAAGHDPQAAIGIASLVIWTILLVVSVKYIMLVMSKDYQGEGGILALMALLWRRGGRRRHGGFIFGGILIFGAALLFGDGAITPAISVLSAVEGLEAVDPALKPLVLPISVGILTALFVSQRFGVGKLAVFFGPVMLVWFTAIGLSGALHVINHPSVLAAFNPIHGLHLLIHQGWGAMAVIGGVVLAVTGAEALYADMGQFGRKPIIRAWYAIVFPALILNYLGQAALAQHHPELATRSNLFFHMLPAGGLREAMVVIATLATIIASQALISGVFSLSSQAIDLGYFPRVEVRYTSATNRGQVYMPAMNLALGIVCVLLVLTFRSSSALAGAFGFAVTGAMIITSLAYAMVLWRVSGVAAWKAGAVLAALLVVDLPLFLSCVTKLPDGGYVPLCLATVVAAVMLTWNQGRLLVRRRMGVGAVSMEEFANRLKAGDFTRLPGMSVYLYRGGPPSGAIASALELNHRVGALRENIVLLNLEAEWEDAMRPAHDISVRNLGGGLWYVHAAHGYMQEPDAPQILQTASQMPDGPPFDIQQTYFIIARGTITDCPRRKFRPWQRWLFTLINRNLGPRPGYLGIPADHLIAFHWFLKL